MRRKFASLSQLRRVAPTTMGVGASDPVFASYILATAADLTEFLSKTHVHSPFVRLRSDQVPVAFLSLMHAVRTSHATRQLSGGVHSRMRLFQSLVLNLIVLFAAPTLVALLLGAPVPILTAPLSVALYSVVHTVLYCTGLGDALLHAHSSAAKPMYV